MNRTRKQNGAGCPCSGKLFSGGGGPLRRNGYSGGYKATRRNRMLLAKLRRGESIGFTATASLKSKGLIPRTSRKFRGKKVVGSKYK